MKGTTSDIDTHSAGNDEAGIALAGRHRRLRLWTHWTLALLTVPAAVVVLIFGIGAVMSTSGCSNRPCQGPSGVVFALLFYSAPAVAALTIIVSFFTARRGWGIVVPICGLVLLGADFIVMALAFRT